jgi:hypothetical protein
VRAREHPPPPIVGQCWRPAPTRSILPQPPSPPSPLPTPSGLRPQSRRFQTCCFLVCSPLTVDLAACPMSYQLPSWTLCVASQCSSGPRRQWATRRGKHPSVTMVLGRVCMHPLARGMGKGLWSTLVEPLKPLHGQVGRPWTMAGRSSPGRSSGVRCP